MASRGLLIVLTGPSGTGKGSLREALIDRRAGLVYCVSATTRPPRPGEADGVDYFFLGRRDFQDGVAEGRFVEWAEVYGYLYGTPREPMDSLLDAGADVIVEKDVQGAAVLMERYPEAVYVFMAPPTLSDLRARVARRGADSPQAVGVRMAVAKNEMQQARRYDYLIINDSLPKAVAELEAIIVAEKRRTWRLTGLSEAFGSREG